MVAPYTLVTILLDLRNSKSRLMVISDTFKILASSLTEAPFFSFSISISLLVLSNFLLIIISPIIVFILFK